MAGVDRLRRVVLWCWIAMAAVALMYVASHPGLLSPQQLAAFLRRHEPWFLVLFLLMSVARALVLLPATPLVLAGALLMPDRPWQVLAISLLSIALTSSLLYGFSDWLGFRERFERAAHGQVARLERWLRHPLGALFVAGWAFFPVVPTDLVCYVAGTVRMPFARFLSAVLVGEGLLCSLYIFGGRAAMTVMG